MKILLFSDSHGAIHKMEKAISKNPEVELVIHLGDCTGDAVKLKQQHPGMQFEIIRGNNDWTREYPDEKLIELENRRILLTHGHQYHVKSGYQRLIGRGKSMGAHGVFFGHTHAAEEMLTGGMFMLNPGSIGLSRQGDMPTCCVLEILEGKFRVKFMRV